MVIYNYNKNLMVVKKGRISEKQYEIARSICIDYIACQKKFSAIAFGLINEASINLACNLKMQQFLTELVDTRIKIYKEEIYHLKRQATLR